ncbi:MAG: hypothetical protein HY040_13770 [Planctomycetes bacterium]|nr:hypothetical protein [Planctomycetota bacterium]
MSRLLWSLLIVGVVDASALVQEPAKQPPAEWAPAPRPIITQVLPYYIPNSLPIPGTREVWQYYGVDSTGRFRPLVVNSPLGAYYLYNGQPYPWTTSRPGIYMPYAVD